MCLTFVKMNDFEIVRNKLIQYLNKTWDKLRDNEQKTYEKNCVILSHLHPSFHHILQSHIYTYIHFS